MSDTPTMTDVRRRHRKYLKPFYDRAIEKALKANERRHKDSPPLTEEEIAYIKRTTRAEVRARADVLSLRAWAAQNDLTPIIEKAHASANKDRRTGSKKAWNSNKRRTNAQRKNKRPQSTSKSKLQEMLDNN